MPDSILFDGVDDMVSVGLGNMNGHTMGSMTIAAIVKRAVDNTYDSLVCTQDINGEHWNMKLSDSTEGNHLFGGNGATDSFTTTQVLTADGWELVAISKASGTVAPSFHRYIYGTSTWLRQTGTVAIADGTAPTVGTDGELQFAHDTFNSWFNGNILIAGVWASVLANATLDGMTLTQQSWYDSGPSEAWRFNSVDPFDSNNFKSFAPGGTSTIGAVNGGPVLDTGDVPAGWTDMPPPTAAVANPDYSKFPKSVLRR